MSLYSKRLREVLTGPERALFARLRNPRLIQDYLDHVPINFELKGETYMSPREALRAKKAHCFEGALLAATALSYHGHKPLLMDFQTAYDDEDHVVAIYKEAGYWGAISKTNHSVLRYRDPVYKTVRELALSYFHEYFLWDRRKSLRAYSTPFDLSRYAPKEWVISPEILQWLVNDLDASRHMPIASREAIRKLRRVSPIEIKNLRAVEWDRKTGKKIS